MWIYDPNRKCNKCGSKDISFFAQRGKKSLLDKYRNKISINNICYICKKNENSEYWYKVKKLKEYLLEKV